MATRPEPDIPRDHGCIVPAGTLPPAALPYTLPTAAAPPYLPPETPERARGHARARGNLETPPRRHLQPVGPKDAGAAFDTQVKATAALKRLIRREWKRLPPFRRRDT
jgi:hypothetical protein